METVEIVRQIYRLPLTWNMWVIEEIIHSIQEDEHKTALQNASDCLYEDYKDERTYSKMPHFSGRLSTGMYFKSPY